MFTMLRCFAVVLVYVATLAYGFNDSSLTLNNSIATPRDYVYGARQSAAGQNAEAIALNAQNSPRQSRSMNGKMSIESFLTQAQPFEVISAFIDQLADESPQAISKVIGQSVEGRDLKIIKIGVDGGKLQPIIFVAAAAHGNDSATISAALYIANQMITGYKSNAMIKKLLDTFEVHILPVVNPDGYHYARTVDPSWAKTRSVNKGSKCLGTNINRNWDVHWGQNGSSTDPCNVEYAGRNPFSSISAHVESNYIYRFRNQIKLMVALYGNGQQINTPYGYTKKLPGNYKSLLAKGKIAAKAMAKPHGTVFKVGSTANIYKAASGRSTDWAHDVAGIPYTYTVKGRLTKNGSGGSTLGSEIKQIAVELGAGVIAFAAEMMKENAKDNLRNLNTGCKCSAVPPK